MKYGRVSGRGFGYRKNMKASNALRATSTEKACVSKPPKFNRRWDK